MLTLREKKKSQINHLNEHLSKLEERKTNKQINKDSLVKLNVFVMKVIINKR